MELEELTISRLSGLKDFSDEFTRLGDEYICAIIDFSSPFSREFHPVRLDGLGIILTLEGEIEININTHKINLGKNQLTVISPNTVLGSASKKDEKGKALFLFLSTTFIQNINISLPVISKTYHRISEAPVMTIEQQNIRMLEGFFNMLKINAEFNTANPDNVFSRNIARSLTASLVYFLMQLATYNLEAINANTANLSGSRRGTYLREFIILVQQNYKQERSVSFYAKKLFISPKYLSALIKETTGRSAAEWIDQYVILEAKNLLRFSGMSVQQVAYALNFNNQSSFGKYFKHLTGISPSNFQKG